MTLGSLLLAVANWIDGAGRASCCIAALTQSATSALHRRWSRPALCCFAIPDRCDPCIAVRTPEGKLVAYSQVCTHLSCAVVYDKAENALFCPCHHGFFNIEGQPVAGPPTRPLPRVNWSSAATNSSPSDWRPE